MKTAELYFLQGRKRMCVSPAQIIRLEGKSNYTQIYFTDHAPVLMAKVLHIYDEILKPHGFIRTHRSHLVNAQHVLNVESKRIVHMMDASSVEISRNKKRQVLARFIQLSNSKS
ncbi:MAG TPA: LytTR family DNA-binding domain-containing protein [Saprospiraceae bacterium]|nr:LytTR family DNA-binding domain-containing protein [Saprospiraceae bacterium]